MGLASKGIFIEEYIRIGDNRNGAKEKSKPEA